MLALAAQLRAGGDTVELVLPVDGDQQHYSRAELLSLVSGDTRHDLCVAAPSGTYRWVIIDRRDASAATVASLGASSATIGLDLGGPGREVCDYLIDLLGTPPGCGPANRSDVGLLPLPERRRTSWPTRLDRVLVTLGREDRGQRSLDIARTLAHRTTAAVTALAEDDPGEPCLTVLRPYDALSEHLHEFDLVVTYFGVTAFEALWARVPVVLLAPTRYHDTLARRAGLPRATAVSGVVRAIRRGPAELTAAGQRAAPPARGSLALTIRALVPPQRVSLLCGRALAAAVVRRTRERTFRREPESNAVVMERFVPSRIRYDESYFTTEYAAQYGRSYVDDFDHIAALGRRRIDDMFRAGMQPGARLLDLGCAYGPFLAAAADRGLHASGLDVSAAAVAYARRERGLDARVADLATWQPAPGERYDAITMWYVIEHLPFLDDLLMHVTAALRSGGILALATPNGSGISARADRAAFLDGGPDDHCFIFTPRTISRVLMRYNLRALRVRVTGHHPERFPGIVGRLASRSITAARLVAGWSRARRLGDTFEWIGVRR